jgi:DNA-binding NtrC family response regulator
MGMIHAIVYSQDPAFVEFCRKTGEEIGLEVFNMLDLANFLLHLQDNDYQVALFDIPQIDLKILNWIKITRKLRPKTPVIILSEQADKNTTAKMYEEGIFYCGARPIHRDIFRDILFSAVKYSNRKLSSFQFGKGDDLSGNLL